MTTQNIKIILFILQLEAKLKTMSNQECAEWFSYNATNDRQFRKSIKENFKNGIPQNVLCTKGIFNEEKKVFSVSIEHLIACHHTDGNF